MIRISALNEDDSSEDEGESLPVHRTATKEAQEAEAFALYNKALSFMRQGENGRAERVFQQLLATPLVQEAAPDPTEAGGVSQPGLLLKYSTYKNLASMASQRQEYSAAMENYLEAVMIDSSDVTVWFKMGKVALKLHHYPLARHAFEQGLENNPRHWPCLDNVVTVLYALSNYEVCLHYVSCALERDPGYVKGLVFMEQIFKEQPSLRKNTAEMFKSCDPSIYTIGVEPDEVEEYVTEALEMRNKKRELSRRPELPILTFSRPLYGFNWKALGESLVATYDYINRAPRPVSLVCKIDVSSYAEMSPTSQFPTPTEPVEELAPVDMTEIVSAPPAVGEDLVTSSVVELPGITVTPGQDSSVVTGYSNNMEQEEEKTDKKKRGRKRKGLLAEEELAGKRRSARVRNTVRPPQEEAINYQELLLKFLPSTLLQVQEEEVKDISQEEAMDTCPPDQGEGEVDSALPGRRPSEGSSVVSTETHDVYHFIQTHQNNSGVIDLLNEYLLAVAGRSHMKWPEGVASVYIKAYSRLRKHFEYPGFLCRDVPDERIRDMAKMCLVHAELKLDKWLNSKARLGHGSPLKNMAVTSPQFHEFLGVEFPGPYYREDMAYMVGLTGCADVLAEQWQEFSTRVFWLKARFMMLQNIMEDATDCFDQTSGYLSYGRSENSSAGLTIKIPNCSMDNCITLDEVHKQLDSLHRCQSLEEVQNLHEKGNDERVVELLLLTFMTPQSKTKVVEIEIQERHAQLLLLQDSLHKLNDCKQCLLWGEVSFNEALQRFVNALTSNTKDDWVNTLTQLLEGINRCLSKEAAILKSLPSKNLVRLSHNLIKVIEISMDVPESAPEMAIGSVLPWILLFRIIQQSCDANPATCSEEHKLRAMRLVEGEDAGSEALDRCLPSSLMLLNIAHEYLGRRSWCVNSEGALLQFTVEVILEQLNNDSEEPIFFRSELEQAMEQCLYCLYGHPNKRAKARHLEDHNVPQIGLTWERAIPVFEYFKPKTMPEFDSYKTSTVSGELENLLRRISALVPQHIASTGSMEILTSYVEGSTSQFPSLLENPELVVPIVRELYYLLADYYFKNKEQAKAIKFYMHDICFNSERFDSWAGMALARSSRLEQKLNAHELKTEGKTEGPIQKHAIAALRCFKRALQLDSSNSKLWIEYGSLAYQLHSHASRQLKQKHIFPLTSDMLEIANNNKVEMLRLAQDCYLRASDCEADDTEEEWLHHYMLGKCAEKMGRPPREFLEHYKQAAQHLHEDMARYPKKITYIYSPPHLAVESLEIYYRMHASILKYLLNHTSNLPYDVFEDFIKQAAEGPFATCQEKKQDRRQDGRETSLDENSSSNLGSTSAVYATAVNTITMSTSSVTMATSSRAGQRRPCRPTPVDHEYARQKSYDSGRSDNESSQDHRSDLETPKKQVMNQRTGTVVTMSDSDSSPHVIPKPCYTSSPYNSPPMCTSLMASSSDPSKGSYPIISSAAVHPVSSTPGNRGNVAPSPFSMASILGDVITRELFSQGPGDTQAQKAPLPVEREKDQSTPIRVSTPAVVTPENSPPKLVQITGATPRISPTDPLQEISPPKLARMMEPEQPTSSTVDREPAEKKAPPKVPKQEPMQVEDQVSSSSQLQSVSEAIAGLQMLAAMGRAPCSKDVDPPPQDLAEMDAMPTLDPVKPDTTSSPITVVRIALDEDEDVFPHGDAEAKEKCLFDEPPKLEPMDTPDTGGTPADTGGTPTDTGGIPAGESSQDSMVAELERLKSEILALNESGGGSMFSQPVDSSVSPIKEEPADSDGEIKTKESENDSLSLSGSFGEAVLKIQEGSAADSCRGYEKPENQVTQAPPTGDSAGDAGGKPPRSVEQEAVDASGSSVDKDVAVYNIDTSGTGEKRAGNSSAGQASRNEVETINLLKSLNNGTREGNGVRETTTAVDVKSSKPDETSGLSNQDIELPNVREESGKNTQITASTSRADSIGVDKLGFTDSDKSGREKPTEDSSNKTDVKGRGFGKEDEEMQVEVQSSREGSEKEVSKDTEVVKNKNKMVDTDGNSGNQKDTDGNSGNQKDTDRNSGYLKGDEGKDKDVKGQEGKGKKEKDAVMSGHSEKEGKNSDKPGKESVDVNVPVVERKQQKSPDEQHHDLVDKCLHALRLCLSRFPQHYKCLYRLAFTYYNSKPHKDIQKCRNMLLGNAAWQEFDYMPSPGLYQERKHTNFFQGLWRIPVEEIDRSGSFAAHMMRSLLLLFEVLKDSHDSRMLYHIHIQLGRTPDQGKKYLKDNDRIKLASLAFDYCLDALDEQLKDPSKIQAKKEIRDKFMLETYKVWQYGLKLGGYAERLNKIITMAFKLCSVDKVELSSGVLEKAILHCQELQATKAKQVAASLSESRGSTQGPMTPPVKHLDLPVFPGQTRSPGVGSRFSQEDSLHLTDPSWLTSDVQAKVPRLLTLEAGERLQIPGVTPLPARHDAGTMRSPAGRPSMSVSSVKSKAPVGSTLGLPHKDALSLMRERSLGALDLSKKSPQASKVSKSGGEFSGVKSKLSLKGMPPTLKGTPPSLKGMPPTKRMKTHNPSKPKPAATVSSSRPSEAQIMADAVAKLNKYLAPQGVPKNKPASAASTTAKSVVKPTTTTTKSTVKAAAASSPKTAGPGQLTAAQMASLAALNPYMNPMAMARPGMLPFTSQNQLQAFWSTMAMNFMAMNMNDMTAMAAAQAQLQAQLQAQTQAQTKESVSSSSSKSMSGTTSSKPQASSTTTFKTRTPGTSPSTTSGAGRMGTKTPINPKMQLPPKIPSSAKLQSTSKAQMPGKSLVSGLMSPVAGSGLAGSHMPKTTASSSFVAPASVSSSVTKTNVKVMPHKTSAEASPMPSSSSQFSKFVSSLPSKNIMVSRGVSNPVRIPHASSSSPNVSGLDVTTPPRRKSSSANEPSSPDCIIISSSQEDSD